MRPHIRPSRSDQDEHPRGRRRGRGEPGGFRPDEGDHRGHGHHGRDDRGPDDRGPDDRGPDDRGPGDRGPGDRGPGDRGGRFGGPDGGRRGGPRGGRGGGRGPRRAQRGDVRTAILLLLADQPMHGYQLMQAMSERTQGAWRPSPGAVYPTIDQLEDEGLATIQAEGGRRLVTLTPAGQGYLADHRAELSDPFAEYAAGAAGPDLREPLDGLHVAARQIAMSGSSTQVEAASQVLLQARRSLYLILAGEETGPASEPGTPG